MKIYGNTYLVIIGKNFKEVLAEYDTLVAWSGKQLHFSGASMKAGEYRAVFWF